MDILFNRIFQLFSLEYMLSVIIGSYFTIKIIDFLNGDKVVPTWMRRTITCISGVVLFFVFLHFTDCHVDCLIASFFAAIFVYDAAIKELFRKLNISYREDADNNTPSK